MGWKTGIFDPGWGVGFGPLPAALMRRRTMMMVVVVVDGA